jgi:glucose-6-phosphate 1-dehydrogenase
MTTSFGDLKIKAPEQASNRLPLPRARESLTLTIFGATGDLTHRKLMPALFAMFCEGLLPDHIAIVGFARRDYDDARFRVWMADSIREFSRADVDPAKLEAFCGNLYYHLGDLNDPDSFSSYQKRLQSDEAFPANHLFYLAVAPAFFEATIRNLEEAELIRPPDADAWTRVVVEKPFGHDLESARALNATVRSHLDESQIFRIDHYLGKETVQNILSFRFANTIFEALFNNRYVDHVEITAAETVGMEKGRGAYFDATGCLRDMVQNHMLQLLCLVAMEPPSSMKADAVRNEKVKVLQSVSPLTPESIHRDAVRGQYNTGQLGGEAVPGYREEDRVDPESHTETYAALKLRLNNWRWAGVPFYLRTGKRLKKRATEIRVWFKAPPLELFQTVACKGDVCDLTHARANVLVFRIQPNEGIYLQIAAKRPAMQLQVESVEMEFDYSETWERRLPEAYERLLLDVMRGDSTLFTRSDEVEAAWAIIDPVLKQWASDGEIPMHAYPAGSEGPEAAGGLIEGTVGWAAG